MKKIATLKTNLEYYKRMLFTFKYHIDLINRKRECPKPIGNLLPVLSNWNEKTIYYKTTKNEVK